jgi:hypothetical protein
VHSHHAVVDLAPVAVPLPCYADRLFAALGHSRLVHHADRLGMSVLGGHDLLTSIPHFLLIPLDRFEKTL